MYLSKSLGQVFLNDKNYIQKILEVLKPKDKSILEIGSGPGELSMQIAKQSRFLYCIEFDPRFVKLLENKFKNIPNVRVIHSDILKFDISKLDEKVVVFGNVPYQISSGIIEYIIGNKGTISEAYLTFQKEFTDKLTAKVSTKAYGFLSCYAQYYAKINKFFDIPRQVFKPCPKVDSSFVKIEFYNKSVYEETNEACLFKVIRMAFNQRRKKIRNSLFLTDDECIFFSSLGIRPDSRAENISLSDYVLIANKLFQRKQK